MTGRNGIPMQCDAPCRLKLSVACREMINAAPAQA
jgi:hypothetical protein